MKISVLGSTGAMGGFVIKKEIVMNFTNEYTANFIGIDVWDIERLLQKSIEQRNEIIKKIENKIKDLLKKNKKRNKKVEFMIKYVVVAFSMVMKFMIYFTKIVMIKNKEAALSGLVLYVQEIRNGSNRTSTAGCGRQQVKRTLYMDALNAIRYNESILASGDLSLGDLSLGDLSLGDLSLGGLGGLGGLS